MNTMENQGNHAQHQTPPPEKAISLQGDITFFFLDLLQRNVFLMKVEVFLICFY